MKDFFPLFNANSVQHIFFKVVKFNVSFSCSLDDLSSDWIPSNNYGKTSRNRCRNGKSSGIVGIYW